MACGSGLSAVGKELHGVLCGAAVGMKTNLFWRDGQCRSSRTGVEGEMGIIDGEDARSWDKKKPHKYAGWKRRVMRQKSAGGWVMIVYAPLVHLQVFL